MCYYVVSNACVGLHFVSCTNQNEEVLFVSFELAHHLLHIRIYIFLISTWVRHVGIALLGLCWETHLFTISSVDYITPRGQSELKHD